jgi:hypothetical protein
MFSPDYGATWLETEIAFDTPSSGNLPHNIIADENWVHILAEPGAGTYVRRQVIKPPLFVAGDYNRNGSVDAADYVVWRNTIGQTGSALAADGDNDLDIDQDDYAEWKNHFGESLVAASPVRAAIPEPSTWLLMITILAVPRSTIRERGRRAKDAYR